MKNNKAIDILGFDGHLVLYCKRHYHVESVDFLVGMRRMWATKCGYDYRDGDKSVDRHIADHLCEIIKLSMPSKFSYLYEIVHYELSNEWKYEGMTTFEKLIFIYAMQVMQMQVREGKTKIINLPKPKKQVLKRIIRGNGRYKDYELVA